MSTRRFCLIILGVLVSVVIAFVLLAQTRFLDQPLGLLRAFRRTAAFRGPFGRGYWQQTIRPASATSKAGQAVAWLDTKLSRYDISDTTAAAWLVQYRHLTAEFPDLRPGLAEFVFDKAKDCQEDVRTRHKDQRLRARSAGGLEVLGPVAVAEVKALRDAEPDNSLWSLLLLSWELGDALEWDPEAPEGPRGQWWWQQAYEPGDRSALDRARKLAQGHSEWGRLKCRWPDWRLLGIEPPNPRSFLGATLRMQARVSVLLPVLAEVREIWRRCLFLGYEALARGDREEARLWFETALSLGRTLVAEDSLLVEVLVAALVLDGAHNAVADWYASAGNFVAAGDHTNARRRLANMSREMSRARDRDVWWAMGVPMDLGRSYVASSYVTATAILASIVAALVWLGAVIRLLLERRRAARLAVQVPTLRWRLGDTLRTVAFALAPLSLFSALLVSFPPSPAGDGVGNAVICMSGVVAAMTPLLVAWVTCGRAWRALRAAGVEGRPSRLWTTLAVLGLAVAAGVGSFWPGVSGLTQRYAAPFTLTLLLAAAAAGVGALALILAAHRRLRGAVPQPARTDWLVRAFAVATLTLVLAVGGSWPALASAADRCTTELLRTTGRETTRILGEGWIKRYFAPVPLPETQPPTQPARDG